MSETTRSDDTPPPRRPRGRPGHSRDDVLRRATELFNIRGYDATSISDLARHLGVTKSAIFHHFDSKESILAAALDEALDGLTAAVAQGHRDGSGAGAYERLRATVEASVCILATHLPAVTLLLRVRGNSSVELEAMRRRRNIDEQLAELVEDAVAEGSLRGDIAPEIVSRLIFGTVNSLVEWYRPDGTADAPAVASAVTTVLFDGLHARAPRRSSRST